MKRKLLLVISTLLMLSILLLGNTSVAAGSPSTTYSDIESAKEAAQRFISEVGIRIFPEWEAADLSNGVAYHDLQGNVICYAFSISLNNRTIGRVVVGNSLYDYGVFEAGSGPYPTIPSDDEVKEAIAKEFDLDFTNPGKPMLVYLGYNQFYAIYEFGTHTVGFNLLSKHLYKADELKSSIATPQEYREFHNNTNKEQGSEYTTYSNPQPLYSNPLPVPLRTQYDQPPFPNDCGPTSGAMIAEYWKTWCPGFWYWPLDHHDLYWRMYCNNWSPWDWGTAPWNFGPGFQSYASARGYSNFGTDWCINRAYSVIQTEINCGRPMGVMFSALDPVYNWHWCAIKGWSGPAEMVIINDPGGWVSYIYWPIHKLTSVVTRIYRTS